MTAAQLTRRLVRDVGDRRRRRWSVSRAFIYYSRNTGDDWYVVWGPFLMAGRRVRALGIPVYLRRSAHT